MGVKEHTLNLLEDYRQIAGEGYMPSPNDYLLFRRQAADEVQKGLEESVGLPVSKPAQKIAEKPQKSAPTKSQKPKTSPKVITADFATEDTLDGEGDESAQSGFDILKNLADPWN